MLYLYDNAIVEDLQKSFNPNNTSDPVVKVFSPEEITGLVAQIKEDNITFPIIALDRQPGVSIDTDRTNFTRIHKGVQSVIDKKTNELYYEKVIPITLEYDMSVLTTNTADMDELVRELIFKYSNMYFLVISLPYECNRKVRFGVVIKPEDIERKSGSYEYLSAGQLYESVIHLRCEGCVMVSYTPAKLTRVDYDIQTTLK